MKLINTYKYKFYAAIFPIIAEGEGWFNKSKADEWSGPFLNSMFDFFKWVAGIGLLVGLGYEAARYLLSTEKDEIKKKVITESILIVIAAFVLFTLKGFVSIFFGN